MRPNLGVSVHVEGLGGSRRRALNADAFPNSPADRESA